jgi:hypothetical protein
MNEKLPIIEIVLYYSVIIASPVIYITYLKRNKKVSKEEIRQNLRIFGTFYVLILAMGLFAFLKD